METQETMTRKERQDWFERGRRAARRIDSIKNTIDRIYARSVSVTANYDSVVVDGTKDPHKFDGYVGLLDDYNRERDECMRVLSEIRSVVNQIEDDRYKTVLEKRYIDCLSWEDIERETNYSEHCYRLHREALKAAEEYIENERSI